MVNPDDPAPNPNPDEPDPTPTPTPEPETEPDANLTATPVSSPYSFYMSTGQIKVNLARTNGELTTEDKSDWTVVDPTGELEQSGNATITTKGVVTATIKRVDPISFKTNTVNIKVMHGGATYVTIPVSYNPYATIMTDSSNKLTTDGPENITTLKINGVAVEMNDYTISSADTSMATVENGAITPLQGGQAVFNVSPKTDLTKIAEAKITFYEPVAKVGDEYYKTLAAAFKAAPSGSTIVMQSDAVESISFAGTAPRPSEYELTLDLNGHTLTGGTSAIYALRVDYGTVTIKDSVGTGGITYGKDYAIVVSHLAGDYPSNLIIENGTFTGKTSVAQVGTVGGTGANTKYYGGNLIIKGGKFITIPSDDENYDSNGNFRYAINMLDMNESNYAGGIYSPSTISVEGGEFYKFDPANNAAESPSVNFVSDGFVSEKDGEWYKVIIQP